MNRSSFRHTCVAWIIAGVLALSSVPDSEATTDLATSASETGDATKPIKIPPLTPEDRVKYGADLVQAGFRGEIASDPNQLVARLADAITSEMRRLGGFGAYSLSKTDLEAPAISDTRPMWSGPGYGTVSGKSSNAEQRDQDLYLSLEFRDSRYPEAAASLLIFGTVGTTAGWGTRLIEAREDQDLEISYRLRSEAGQKKGFIEAKRRVTERLANPRHLCFVALSALGAADSSEADLPTPGEIDRLFSVWISVVRQSVTP